jgi:hypothetical protein
MCFYSSVMWCISILFLCFFSMIVFFSSFIQNEIFTCKYIITSICILSLYNLKIEFHDFFLRTYKKL